MKVYNIHYLLVQASEITACKDISKVAKAYTSPKINRTPYFGKVKISYRLVILRLGLIRMKLMMRKNKVGRRKKNILTMKLTCEMLGT